MLTMHRVSRGRWHVPPMCLHTTAVHTKNQTGKVRIPLHGTLFCIKPSHGIPPPRSSFKVWPSQKNSLMSPRLAQTAQQKHSRLHEIKTSDLRGGGWRAFRVLYFYLGDLTLETSSPDNNVISAGFKQQTLYSSSFDTVGFIFKITKWILVWRSACGTWTSSFFFFWKKKWENKHKKKTTELHWCQLIYMCSF